MPRRSVLLIAVAAFFAIAAPASAGYVTVEEECEGCETEERLAFYDDDGETNSLSVATDGEEILVTDEASPLEAVKPCIAETAHRARCPTIGEKKRSYGIQYVYVFLGKGNDTVDFAFDYSTPVGALVEGYSGHDRIFGTNESDDLMGGSGGDRIEGRGGNDNIKGDGWFFEESEEPNAKAVRDVLEGNAGNDTISAGDNENGGNGGDQLRGGPGNDHVIGEWMPESIKGGRGDDVLQANDGKAGSTTKFVCGPGIDLVHAFPVDRISRSCERAQVGDLLLTTAPSAFDASTGDLSFSAECPLRTGRACQGKLRLWAGREIAAKTKFNIDGRTTEILELTLEPGEAKRVAQNGQVFSFRAAGENAGFKMLLKANGA